MRMAAMILCLLVATLGVVGVASPARLLGIVRLFENRTGIYVSAALRILLGIALYDSASVSRFPLTLRVFGVIILVAGLITPFFGVRRFQRILNWWSERKSGFMRVWAGFALAIGLFLAYAVAS